MAGKTIDNTSLQVQLARRQPQIEPINDASSSAVWSTIGELLGVFQSPFLIVFIPAASHSQKGSHKDKREMVVYEDMFG